MNADTLIATSLLAQRLHDPDWAIVDCRFALADPDWGRRAYLEAHVPGAVYAHLDEDLSGPVLPGVTGRHPLPAPTLLAARLGRWGISPGVQVVAYDDQGGAYAARLWWLLRWLGHEAVAVLDGGWPAWQREQRSTTGGEEERSPRTFPVALRPELVAAASDVDAIHNDPAWRLLDIRNADRYRGENETIDPVAGHIPGAVSAPYAGNLDAEGRFLAPARLAERYAALLGDVRPERTVCYCGSGVTACHALLALHHAGLGEGKLYAGSWSEWITATTRPVAVGP